MKRGYLAGPLFNEAEVAQRIKEGKILKEKTNIDWYNPIEAPVNDKSKLPTAADIFALDTKMVLESDYIIADLSNNDVGVAYELGLVWLSNKIADIIDQHGDNALAEIKKIVKRKNVVGVTSDIRIPTAHHYQGHLIPYGLNQYVIGGVLDQGNIVYKFEDTIKYIKKEDLK